ncbi:MAG TPA: 2-amino-4-hydroxy-6-hydroxymethyldihydropteridine diphosphokinase [Actinomycetes bacterium]|nr:2-amino-4-hydroxy-6-hydroxymethyldihydropteridine diphosphokinase [Actinomycetes bacterium]
MSRVPQRAVLALGSNLGDRLGMLQGALDALAKVPGIEVIAVSGVYETAPVGGPPGQDLYLNAVILVDTTLPASVLLERGLAVEGGFGRRRNERWGPRTLDIDVITYDDQVSADERLTLPHPRAYERAFVLVPWLSLDEGATLPGRGRVAELAAARRPDSVVTRTDLRLHVPVAG